MTDLSRAGHNKPPLGHLVLGLLIPLCKAFLSPVLIDTTGESQEEHDMKKKLTGNYFC